MSESSQSITRMLALIAFTAIFAGLWSNDQPVRAMALKNSPIPHGIAGGESRQKQLQQGEPEWVPVTEPRVETQVQTFAASLSATARQVSMGSQSKSFTIESADLLIADQILHAHLDQLPLGMAAGNYRIVDSLGGVGWLRVRINGAAGIDAGENLILSTTVNEESMRFIRVAETALGIQTHGTQK